MEKTRKPIHARWCSDIQNQDYCNMIKSVRFTRRGAILSVGSITLMSAIVATAGTWSSPEITVRIVTADGKPLQHAQVVANWEITNSLNGAPLGQLALVEVMTNKDGYFRIPAWGPRFLLRGHVRGNQPVVRVFKAGYIPLILPNADIVPENPAPLRIHYRFHNQTVSMNSFTGDRTHYEQALLPLVESINSIVTYGPVGACYWKQFPRLLLALEEQKKAMAVHGGGHLLREAHQYAKASDRATCGDAQEFFQDYHG